MSKNKQDQGLLQTSNGIGVIVSRQMLSLMHDKKFMKVSQAAAFLGLFPIQSLNPFSK
ncbi:transposase [Psychrobacter piscatorii]|uniref:transposase n=1 Tax=Psychrobacter piscatorii TaxID=554343 RepID=UPI003735229E